RLQHNSQCREIEKAIGGALELSKITGSRAYERYTRPQIRKIFETQQETYENTERISLVSSFMACLFLAAYACINTTDGAGMNLMDIKQRKASSCTCCCWFYCILFCGEVETQ
ncbi:hypothetical protein Gotur_007777, partial [Gossypium turneri]